MFWLEYHWYRTTPLQLILFPISLLYRALVAMRSTLYRNRIMPSKRLPVPVIVVGNISVGGTGKTPLTLALAQQLADCGWHPLIVSRGYGGAALQPQHVDECSQAQQVGDEPLLMARRRLCPVWIGKDRAATAQAALKAHPLCNVVLCDDGLQHYRLQRDMEIAVIDGARGFGNGHMLPAGPLREPTARLATVDAIVVNEQDCLPNPLWMGKNEVLREFTGGDRYAMRLTGETFHNLLDPGKKVDAAYFSALNNHAVAGIGNPQRYFQYLQTLGISHTPHAFPDHYPYSASDLAFAACDAILLTEKDAVKCASFADARFWVLRVDAKIDASLIEYILRKIKLHGLQTT